MSVYEELLGLCNKQRPAQVWPCRSRHLKQVKGLEISGVERTFVWMTDWSSSRNKSKQMKNKCTQGRRSPPDSPKAGKPFRSGRGDVAVWLIIERKQLATSKEQMVLSSQRSNAVRGKTVREERIVVKIYDQRRLRTVFTTSEHLPSVNTKIRSDFENIESSTRSIKTDM